MWLRFWCGGESGTWNRTRSWTGTWNGVGDEMAIAGSGLKKNGNDKNGQETQRGDASTSLLCDAVGGDVHGWLRYERCQCLIRIRSIG